MTSKIAHIRQACEIVEAFKKHHQPFVAIPIIDDPELIRLLSLIRDRLEELEKSYDN